ncbi:MAG TPA: alpha/beta hydrolase [Polyangiaceae bacterium]|nr:alpha/beta hydrolase [Polyangiaceae bacterium]
MASRDERNLRASSAASLFISILALGACHAGAPSPSAADVAFARPAQMVAVGPSRLNLHCMGSGSPVVVLEAGLGGDSSGWARVQPRLAQATRVCSYDRAGYYFSEPGPMPRTAEVAVADLHSLLEVASIRAPIVLVGHSLGGLLVRLYAAKYPQDIAGLVLLDPVLDNVEDERPHGESDAGEEDPLFVKCLASAKNGTITTDPALRKDCIGPPDARLSSELNAAQAEAAARATTWQTMLSEGKEMRSGRTGARVRAAHEKLDDLPLVVVTKGVVRTPPGDEAKLAEAYFGRTVLRHAELARRSRRGLHLVARSGHQMHMDDPDIVAAGVQAVLRAYRENRAVIP